MVETLQQPELQLVEEKIETEEELAQSDLAILGLVGLWVRHSRCGQRTTQVCIEYCTVVKSVLQEYRSQEQTTSPGEGEGGVHSECQRRSILKKQQSCDTSPDLIPHQDQGGPGHISLYCCTQAQLIILMLIHHPNWKFSFDTHPSTQ